MQAPSSAAVNIGTLGGFASTHLIGQLASTGAYNQIFLMMGALHPLAWFVAWVSLRGKP